MKEIFKKKEEGFPLDNDVGNLSCNVLDLESKSSVEQRVSQRALSGQPVGVLIV